MREDTEHVLLLDAGNAWKYDYGLAGDTQGRVIVDGMNRMGYDAMALAADEVNFGMDILKERLSEAEFAVLSTNMVYEATGDPFIAPSIIREMGGHHIAIIGVTSPMVQMLLDGRQTGLKMVDPLPAVQSAAEALRDQAGIIIVLSNLGSETDEKLAAQIPEIDVIIGGQNGKILTEPLRPLPDGAIIAQAGSLGKQIGVLTLDFNGAGELVDYREVIVDLPEEVPPDPEMVEWLQTYRVME